jgi:hypothetical protein
MRKLKAGDRIALIHQDRRVGVTVRRVGCDDPDCPSCEGTPSGVSGTYPICLSYYLRTRVLSMASYCATTGPSTSKGGLPGDRAGL